MNPETGRLEALRSATAIGEESKELAALEAKLSGMAGLLRPDGSPVPKHWSVFTVDELVEIKGATFKIVYLGETNVLLETVKPSDVLKKAASKHTKEP